MKYSRFLYNAHKIMMLQPSRLLWMLRLGFIKRWLISIRRMFLGPDGWKLVASCVGAYLACFAIIESWHNRLAGQASFERSAFISMVSSGRKNSIETALKNFGDIQNMEIPSSPQAWAPWGWLRTEKPNEKPLKIWSHYFFSTYQPDSCELPLDLRLADLRNADLEGAKLQGANLQGARLQKAKLEGAKLQAANLGGANFECANLEQAYLQQSIGIPIVLQGNKIISLEKQRVDDGRQVETNFRSAILVGADLREAKLCEATFENADLRHANLTAACLENADLNGAKLHKAKLQRANLRGARLQKAKGLTKDQINQAYIDDNTKLPPKLDGLKESNRTLSKPCGS